MARQTSPNMIYAVCIKFLVRFTYLHLWSCVIQLTQAITCYRESTCSPQQGCWLAQFTKNIVISSFDRARSDCRYTPTDSVARCLAIATASALSRMKSESNFHPDIRTVHFALYVPNIGQKLRIYQYSKPLWREMTGQVGGSAQVAYLSKAGTLIRIVFVVRQVSFVCC